MGVGGDEVRDANAAGFEGVEEGAPVGLCLRECAGDAQDNALAVLALDADRVDTPWRYISAMAALSARSEREPFSRREVWNGEELSRTWGTLRWSFPRLVLRERGLNPLE